MEALDLFSKKHIFDFEKDIYGRRITVQFIEKIREEVKFDSIDLLKSQIKKDIEEGKEKT
ncbi:MAG: hypothetical protein Ct9H90mP6_02300 [Gammaproteobacteria bacterium]|nr:MAG: hypothetical protein Ct9H90mP6_02300 [Gammaproteobacteria bacterium]